MRFRTVIILLIFSTALFIAKAQDYHFSQFLPATVYVNPAWAAIPETAELGLTYRNQWPGIPATFVTYGASFILPVKSLQSGIGIHVVNDMQAGGVINRTAASLLYGYSFQINRYWSVSAGLSASWVLKRFNADKLVFRSDLIDGYDPVIMENYTKNYPDFSVGLIAQNSDDLIFGVSVAHVTRPVDATSDVTQSRLPLKYTAFISGRLIGSNDFITSGIKMDPSLMYSYQHNNQELIWGSQFMVGSNLLAGAWMRQNLKFNFESIIVLIGISYEKYNIGYSYDVNLKKINFLSTKMAAHEVTFLYRFEYKDRKRGKIDCPAY